MLDYKQKSAAHSFLLTHSVSSNIMLSESRGERWQKKKNQIWKRPEKGSKKCSYFYWTSGLQRPLCACQSQL